MAFDNIKGFLFDIDGVLSIGNDLIPGALATIEKLKAQQIPYRFVTNTSTKSLDTLHKKLQKQGFPIAKNEVFHSPLAAVLHMREQQQRTCYLFVEEEAKKDFAEFTISEKPEVIVVGFMEKGWDLALLNKAFRMVMAGAEFIALHKNKYFQVQDGLQLDSGALVVGLEYVTGKEATVVGKPSASFFELALQSLGLPPHEVAMIGDDIEADIGGAQNCGLKGILVKTGKYREELVRTSWVKPDLVIESVGCLFDYVLMSS
ncbi:TIGR01458 family HAD-type hydrolase [Candidatus Uabimicrobium amorphum]|uniref:Haloacid dehalogenase-like hydrolase domain-containing protein 2 n=1 Tax=Uabimicrobium amorphum TaxID=2596890 RepID=A0A5S9F3E6_UABAM|nr:TIGR01458 family HAD-type hydrolase [Candidatus Uabimicrobium amorphum]BBM84606.1 haloacid dehalogenase [Candidatus Uabimicrobium amorphum]